MAQLTKKQTKACLEYERLTGMDLLELEDIETGEKTFQQVWDCNRHHLAELHLEIQQMVERAYCDGRSTK